MYVAMPRNLLAMSAYRWKSALCSPCRCSPSGGADGCFSSRSLTPQAPVDAPSVRFEETMDTPGRPQLVGMGLSYTMPNPPISARRCT